MKHLILILFATIISFTATAQADLEPSTAFSLAYDTAMETFKAQHQGTQMTFGPRATVNRGKNVPGTVGQFIVTLEVSRLGANWHYQYCEAEVMIQRLNSEIPNQALSAKVWGEFRCRENE